MSDSWNFHPKPQSKPITPREAFAGLQDDSGKEFPDWLKKAALEMDAGNYNHRHVEKAFLKYKGSKSGSISFKLLAWDRVACTICKQWISIAGMGHPNRQRYLNASELKRIGSFPDNFIFPLGFDNVVERIGNSVPPNLMRAIAENLRLAPFMKGIKQPTVISTFAGCGGSSLGYHLAGFKELLAVEWDDNAVQTFKLNFPDVPVYHGDISKLSVEECMRLAGLNGPGELDCFDGSPPCQGFSTAGKRKFDDPRNSLFKEYARLLKGLQPKCFVMENVTGMLKGYMKQVYLQIVAELRDCGYTVKGQVMNAMYYNVPQSRERVIIIGVRSDLV